MAPTHNNNNCDSILNDRRLTRNVINGGTAILILNGNDRSILVYLVVNEHPHV